MIEIAGAALVPAVVVWGVARSRAFGDDFRRAVARWFIPLVLVWFAPCWLTGRSPASFDYLREDVVPWMQPGFRSANPLLSDPVLQFVPWREAARRSILAGSMPFLDRSDGAGSPLWENPQAAVAFPLTLLGLPFSSFAWPLFAAVSKALIALCGTFLFLRSQKASEVAAICGAIAYAFCAFNVAWLLFPHTNVTVMLPFVLLAIERCRTSARAAAGLAIALALMLVAGHPESVLHCAMLAVPFAVWRGWDANQKPETRKGKPETRNQKPETRRENEPNEEIVEGTRESAAAGAATLAPSSGFWFLVSGFPSRVLAGGILAILLSAPVVLPFVEYLPLSERFSRLARQPEIMQTPPPTLANLSAFFADANLLSTRDPRLFMNFNEVATQYAGLGAFALAVAAAILDARRQRFWIAALLLSSFFAFDSAPARAITSHVPLVDIAVHGRLRFVAAFSIAMLAAKGVDLLLSREQPRIVAAIAIAFALLAIPFVKGEPAGLVAVVCAIGIAVAALLPLPEHLLPLFVACDLAVLLVTYNVPTAREFFYPQNSAAHFLQTQPGIFRVAGIDNALRGNVAAVLDVENIGFHDPMAFEPYGRILGLGGYDRATYFNSFHRLPPRALLDFLGVRWIVAPPGLTGAPLPIAYAGSDATILVNPGAKPRAFALTPGAAVQVTSYAPNREAITVRAPSRARIVTSEAALPGWRLTRNGRRWPVVKLRDAFIGFEAPAGEGTFELRYLPVGLKMGSLLALIGLGGTVLLLGSGKKPVRHE